MNLNLQQIQYLSSLMQAISLWCTAPGGYQYNQLRAQEICKAKMLNCIENSNSIPTAIQTCLRQIGPIP